ncbi:metal-sulfur cluster assembly factor [Candidatus Microgenomates bacterium]|nr:metal-sulfur cluster assembly factor [Candidatus Microgenomates bacterium]
MLNKKILLNALKNVPDPELGISVVDLGLIYDVRPDKKGNVEVVMTLTTMGCPLFSLMEEPIKEELYKIKGVKKVTVELTFDPPWSIDRMSKEAKIKLGFL